MSHYYATGLPCGHRIDSRLRDKLITLLSRGQISIPEAVDFGGVTYATVRSWLTSRGIDVRKARQRYVKELFEATP